MDAAMDNTAVKTIDLLEARLMRITYVLSGFSDEPDSALLPSQEREAEETVTVRLGRLEHALARLAHKSKVVEDILAWYARHASLLSPDSTHDIPSSLDPEALLAIIMTQATMYPAVSSSLTSILDIPIPPADSSAHLIAHGPKMAELDGSLERQAAEPEEIVGLHGKSALHILSVRFEDWR
ncbi:MAG: hypothetical protein M1838_000781 [Thelocarpon superellum]|nr:MAG: hypothetical protein M1838_000781 [Thelocarpon superellum]